MYHRSPGKNDRERVVLSHTPRCGGGWMTERQPYERIAVLRTTLRGHALQVFTKPGLPHWDQVTAATALLAETLVLPREASVLLLGCRQGALGVAIALDVPDGTVT